MGTACNVSECARLFEKKLKDRLNVLAKDATDVFVEELKEMLMGNAMEFASGITFEYESQITHSDVHLVLRFPNDK
jgi:hypothetical protein